ncbi:Wall-associated protein precursor [Stigmatella sp. ncwal1]|uniref:Wall-associated protein n=1 Tax=Stigmatella ashevillensis TaxID=2995309 RepID=A0ABT5DCS8_9BACT|nr:Wall-associated protein precursor [Stigmatella ashevillena]MDC0711477.1 Wall-associated protein precursor [Stigmatella ashevillena]
MLALILLLVTSQVPTVPGETSLVSSCKQGMASACAALRQVSPKRAAEAERAFQRWKIAEETREQESSVEFEALPSAPEPPDCKGQEHHVISRLIARQLERHPNLRGVYKPRDSRFVAQAESEDAHCGYQHWHRGVDKEVIAWLIKSPKATRKEFEQLLREIYNRPEMRARFPNGF